MKRTLILFSTLVALCTLSEAQVANVDCPRLDVHGPEGNIPTDRPVRFTAVVSGNDKPLTLEYDWTATATGQKDLQIISGQGTPQIEIIFAEPTTTVIVKVKGLPAGCPSIATETIIIDHAPQALVLDQFRGPLSGVKGERFAKVIEAMRAHPQSLLYVVVGAGRDSSGKTRQRREELLKRMGRLPEDYRVTFTEDKNSADTITIWLVPPGASLPKTEN